MLVIKREHDVSIKPGMYTKDIYTNVMYHEKKNHKRL